MTATSLRALRDSAAVRAPDMSIEDTDRGDLIGAVRELAPLIRTTAARIEQRRRLPPGLVAAITEAELFRMNVPAALGGLETDPVTLARVIEQLAMVDLSVAWCVMLAAQNANYAGFLPEAGAREVYGDDPRGVVAGVLRPVGVATLVPGGYRVRGRWPFASGIRHATWFAGECVVQDGDTPLRDAEGEPVIKLLLLPRGQVTVHDTWTTTGLRGTGSNDVSAEDVFVPVTRAYRIHHQAPLRPEPVYREQGLIFTGHGSIGLGAAQAALDTMLRMLTARGERGDTGLETPVAEAQALLESARAYLYDAAADLWQTVAGGGTSTATQRARLRLATSHALRSGVQVVDSMYALAGTRAIAGGGPLDRLFRDVHTAAAHVMTGPATYVAAGRVALGREPRMLFF